MVTLSTSMILALLLAGAITTLAMLSVFANIIGHETQLHDLRNRVKDLHFEYAMYLARINNQIKDDDGEVLEAEEIFDEQSNEDLQLTASTDPLRVETDSMSTVPVEPERAAA